MQSSLEPTAASDREAVSPRDAETPCNRNAAACSCGSPGTRPTPARRVDLRSARGQWPLLPALALVLLPKCPLCLLAYCSVLGSLGASSALIATWGLPLGGGLLATAVVALALRARSSGCYGPLLFGSAAAVVMLGAKFVRPTPGLLYAGAVALVAASLWSVHGQAQARP